MKAIILSAGQGKRLLPRTLHRPKSSLEAGGRSLLEWQLSELAKTAVSNVVVITGFAAGVLEDLVSHIKQPATRTLYNPFFAHCDNLGTCWIAREEMYEPFMIINGDTLFEAAIVNRLLQNAGQYPITLAMDRKQSYDGAAAHAVRMLAVPPVRPPCAACDLQAHNCGADGAMAARACRRICHPASNNDTVCRAAQKYSGAPMRQSPRGRCDPRDW